jgi:hypothetical protein
VNEHIERGGSVRTDRDQEDEDGDEQEQRDLFPPGAERSDRVVDRRPAGREA